MGGYRRGTSPTMRRLHRATRTSTQLERFIVLGILHVKCPYCWDHIVLAEWWFHTPWCDRIKNRDKPRTTTEAGWYAGA